MNLGEINDILRYIANKTQGGNLPPNRFQDIMNMASRMLLDDYLPSRNKNSIKTAYEEDERITAAIRTFKQPIDLQIDTNGQALYPNGFVYKSSCRKVLTIVNSPDPAKVVRKEINVNFLDDDAIGGILTSRIVGPKLSRPYATEYADYIQFWPYNLQVCKLTYIKEPIKIVYATTLVNNRPVYDPTASVETDWPVICQNELIIKALSLMGINLREEMLLKFVAEREQGGV